MTLEVHKNGAKLFFITCAVTGRRPLLSRLVDAQTRPELLPLGEVVKAGLLALHPVWPSVGISDYVIMPDHIHFLLVVDFVRDSKFNPLWATHRLLDAIETAWHHRGQAPAPPGMVEALKAAVAQGRPVAAALERGEAVCGRAGTGVPALFERHPWLDLSFDPRQLKAIRHYIRLNPARALWKAAHPDLFICHRAIRAARLLPFAPRRFDGIGNLSLLGSPFLFHVRLTLKKTVVEHEQAIVDLVEKARRGWVPVSGFISPGEKEALRRLKAEPRARFIRLLPHALPAHYDPSAEDSREMAAGRLLILSPVAEVAAIPALDMRRHEAAAHQFRANCLLMNEIGAQLCEQAAVVTGHQPGRAR